MTEYPQFIGSYFLDDISLCDELIQYHTERRDGQRSLFNPDVKESIDIPLDLKDNVTSRYYKQLVIAVQKYVKHYPEAGGNSRWTITEPIGIQWYPIGGGYKTWHCERHGKNRIISARHLVFMTYLNDVDDGGTEFKYQNYTTPAKKGMTLIWPTDWTFTHRGQISYTKEKCVTTGWFSHIQ